MKMQGLFLNMIVFVFMILMLQTIVVASPMTVYGPHPKGTIMTPTPTPTMPEATPTPVITRTCTPIIAEIWINSVDIADNLGDCSDSDGFIDAGERISVAVTGYSTDSCAWSPGTRTVEVTTNYPFLTPDGWEQISDPEEFNFNYLFYFNVENTAQCMDTALLTVSATVQDWMWQDTDTVNLSYLIEVDETGPDTYECDAMPCGEEPTSTPTPTPTFVPCIAEIYIYSVFIDDTLGDCTDNDGLIDAGESFAVTVAGYSQDSYCWTSGNRDVWITCNYPHIFDTGFQIIEDGFNFEYVYFFDVDSQAQCMDEAALEVHAYVYDDMGSDFDSETVNCMIEVDETGPGTYECDAMPCGEFPIITPTPTPTPTLTMTPTGTPTCMPCLAEIYIYTVSIDDTLGDCTDNDGLIDAGESFAVTVTGYSQDSCCWTPGNRSVSVTSDYPHFFYLGMDVIESGFNFEFVYYFEVAPEAQCMDVTTLEVNAYVEDDMWEDWDEATVACTIEVDEISPGNYECDDTPCEGVPTPTATPACLNDGDLNNDFQLTPEDSLTAFQIYLAIITDPSYEELCSADCDASNSVSPADALCIFRHYLSGDCDCSDSFPVNRPSLKAKSVSPLSPSGTLMIHASLQEKEHICEISLNLKEHSNEITAIGFQMEVPDTGVKFVKTSMGHLVQNWMAADQQMENGILTFGAFDPILSIKPSQTGEIATFSFTYTDINVLKSIRFFNLNSHLQNFQIL